MVEGRLKRNEPQPRSCPKGLYSVAYLEFMINVCKVKIYGSLGHEQTFRRFLAAVALGYQAENLNFPLRQPYGTLHLT